MSATPLSDARRFIMMDNVIRHNAEPLKKGIVVTLSDLDGCDVNHLLRIKAIRPWGGSNGRVSDILLRRDKPTDEEYQEEIGRLQTVLESLEAEIEGLRKAPPPEPSKMPAANHILAEQVAELEVENARLKKSLKDAQEQRDAARARADKYAAALSTGTADDDVIVATAKAATLGDEDTGELLAAAGTGEEFGDDVGKPAPPVRGNAEGREPVPAISKRYRDRERDTQREEMAEPLLDMLSVPVTGPGAPIHATTHKA